MASDELKLKDGELFAGRPIRNLSLVEGQLASGSEHLDRDRMHTLYEKGETLLAPEEPAAQEQDETDEVAVEEQDNG